MILTDYYRFDKLAEVKSKSRLDCTYSTREYNPLEVLRNKKGELFAYLLDNTYTSAETQLVLSRGYTHISKLTMPDVNYSFGYGDMIHTPDALLFVFSNFKYTDGHPSEGTRMEIFVARGKCHNQKGLYNLLCDGELLRDMAALRATAIPEGEELPK